MAEREEEEMILKSDKAPELTEEEKRAFAQLIPPEERRDWESETEARIALLERAWQLRLENAYLKGKVEVFEGFATRRLELRNNR